MTENTPAVLVRKARKQYGSGTTVQPVLENLNMTVYMGNIYGLLGASGSGKTTLLSCIVGRQHLDSGEIWVLGGKPGSKRSGVPGARVGYMPQEVALIGEFTVKGAVQYFGWICGMKNEEIHDQFMFLKRLLELPPDDHYVKNLSGGQQRRLSFAAALVQSPELLILDEPTVGLDPVLRASIWDHLVELTVQRHLTVIITTHYIEEAAQAHKIGLLRGGRLLAEQHPSDLMASFNCSLEEVFLILSRRQETSQQDAQAENLIVSTDQEIRKMQLPKYPSKQKYYGTFSSRMKALLVKNFARIFRHVGGLFFLVLFPILELVVFFLAIGGEPQGLKFAIVNQELHNASDCTEYSLYNPTEPILYPDLRCDFSGLSCNYLNRIDETKIYYKDLESARESVRRGQTTGMLHFYSNFSSELQKRRDKGNYASNETLEHSSIIVHLDMSDRQILLFTMKHLTEAYMAFSEYIFEACNLSTKLGKIPMQYNDPIYGDGTQNYAEFMTPGLIITMIFFLATSITSTIIITERNEGVWDRSIVAGVKSAEILLSHIVSQSFCMIIQLIIVVLFTFVIFKVPCLGDVCSMVILLFLQGFCGMCYGFLVSAICDNLTTGNYVALGSFYPTIFLSGMLWPTEGMPRFLYYIARLLPSTIPIESLHDILERGRSLVESQVYKAYLVTIVWIFLQVGLCLLVLRLKSK